MKKMIKMIVNAAQGLKGPELASRVAVSLAEEENRNLSYSEFDSAIRELVDEKEIVEVCYILPQMDFREKSMFFPKGTVVNLGSK